MGVVDSRMMMSEELGSEPFEIPVNHPLSNFVQWFQSRWHRPQDVLQMGFHINHQTWGLCHINTLKALYHMNTWPIAH